MFSPIGINGVRRESRPRTTSQNSSLASVDSKTCWGFVRKDWRGWLRERERERKGEIEIKTYHLGHCIILADENDGREEDGEKKRRVWTREVYFRGR